MAKSRGNKECETSGQLVGEHDKLNKRAFAQAEEDDWRNCVE